VCVPAVCMVSAVGCLFLLAASIHAAGVVFAANTSIYAAALFDIAGWLVSATSHLVSAVLSLILLAGWSLPLVTSFLLVVCH
ncbi:hypothetical protein Tco_0239189, partial [Tanacetum coccineum]